MIADKINMIHKSFNDIINENPTIGYGISYTDDGFMIYVNSYENYMNNEKKRKISIANAMSLVDGLVKKLKENYRNNCDDTLKIKVVAENFDIETISMNNRHKLTVKKLFVLES